MSPFLTTIKIIIGVTGLLGNALVVVVFYKYKTLFQQVKSVYIVNQSFIDGLVSALLIAVSFVRILPRRRYEGLMDDVFCKLWLSQILLWGLMSSSSYNLMATSVERYMAIVHPIWHKVSFTKTKANALVVFIWLFGVLSIASYVIPTTGIKDSRCLISVFWPSWEIAVAVGILQTFLNMILPILVHCICYARILAVLRKRVTKVMPSDSRGTHSCTSTQTRATVHESTSVPSTSARGTSPFPARTKCSKTFPVIRQLSQNSLNEKAKRNVIKTLAIVTI